ncbi:MAG: FAD-dependent oxidoreductase [Blastocatellia bacterium]
MSSDRYQSVVIGAGAFGGWSAYQLLQRGATVLLCDSWGPGNSRASSGGETRLIRSTYGPDAIYTRMAVRALELWKYNERRWRRKLYHRTGLIWMVTDEDDSYEQKALEVLIRSGVAFEQLNVDEAACRFPQIDFDGVRWVIYEHEAGYLTARQACQTVVDAFVSQNGVYKQAMAWPGSILL